MGNDSPKAQKPVTCILPNHIDDKFPCMGTNCNIAPFICKNCAYQSKKDASKYMCKLCKVTEQMEDIDVDSMEIDTNTSSHSIKMVASVSFDRQKRQFKYAGDHEGVFGKEVANQMKAKQGGAGAHAINRFAKVDADRKGTKVKS